MPITLSDKCKHSRPVTKPLTETCGSLRASPKRASYHLPSTHIKLLVAPNPNPLLPYNQNPSRTPTLTKLTRSSSLFFSSFFFFPPAFGATGLDGGGTASWSIRSGTTPLSLGSGAITQKSPSLLHQTMWIDHGRSGARDGKPRFSDAWEPMCVSMQRGLQTHSGWVSSCNAVCASPPPTSSLSSPSLLFPSPPRSQIQVLVPIPGLTLPF